jgi:hypothetical protein
MKEIFRPGLNEEVNQKNLKVTEYVYVNKKKKNNKTAILIIFILIDSLFSFVNRI